MLVGHEEGRTLSGFCSGEKSLTDLMEASKTAELRTECYVCDGGMAGLRGGRGGERFLGSPRKHRQDRLLLHPF